MSKLKEVNQFIFEIRFEPDVSLIDKRGSLATALMSKTFDQWQVSHDRIDISSKDTPGVEAFLSIKNAGLSCSYPNDVVRFTSEVEYFIKTIWPQISRNKILRLGMRTRYLTSGKNFKSLFDLYRKKFLAITDDDLQELGGTLVDIGFPLNFIDGDCSYNINTGPMEKKQFSPQIKDLDGIFDSAIYLDCDYSKEEISPNIKQREVLEFIRSGISKAEKTLNVISEWVV